MMIFSKKQFAVALIMFCCFLLPVSVLAVVNSTGYAWGENAGWANFNSTNGGATVSATGVTGYVWLENIGWVQLDYDGVAGATNTTSTNWGVTNDGNGNLGGYAWGENVGWINFHPTNSQVTISGGNFSGYAWSENIGWIKMDHAQTNYRPTTTWSAVAAPTVTISTALPVESTTATLNGNVIVTGGENPTVTVYWGTTNGGQVTGNWTNNFTPPTSPAQPQGVAAFYHNVTGLSPGTTYYFSANATNSWGTGWPGTSLSFLTKPAAPTNVAATDGTHADKTTVTWTKSTGATGYRVYEGSNLLATLEDVATYDDTTASAPIITAGNAVATDGTGADDVALSLSGALTNDGASRIYKIIAFNVAGDSADSTTNTGYRGVGSLTYQWQKSSADSDADYSNIDGATSATYNDTVAPIYTVNAPTLVAVSAQSTGVLRITFSGASVTAGDGRYYKCILNATGATQQTSSSDSGYRNDTIAATGGYEVFSDTAADGAYLTSEGTIDSSPFDDTGLSANTRKYYKVKSKSTGGGWSSLSTVYDGKYTLVNAPGTPALTVDSASQITVTLTSDSNPSGTKYLITNTTNSANSGWTTDSSWISSGLICNTEYTFTVMAKNGDGVETATSTASATTSACPSQISGGGGLPPAAYLPPTPPLNGFQLLINGGSATTDSQNVNLTIRGSSDTLRMSVSNDINFANGVQEPYTITKPWKLSDSQGQKTVYLKFFTAYGVSSDTITATINYQVPNILTPIINIINPPAPPTSQNQPVIIPIPPQPPVAEAVPEQVPLSMQDIWNLLPTHAINNFVLSPVPQEISALVQKFPELSKTLEAIGFSKITDVGKLLDNQLILPNISQITNLADVSLENLTAGAKGKIPTEILFAKTNSGLVDYNTTLSLNEQGHPQQSINVMVNQPIQLIIKPDKPAKAIRGYLIFKQNKIQPASKINASKLTASLLQKEIDINQTKEPTDLKQALVLLTFNFADPNNDGIWTADITAPVVDGQYEILTVIDYQDQRLQPKELSMITVVDPEGYVYAQTMEGIEGRIPNAKVSLYWLNPENKQYKLWPAKDFQQVNPQITDNTGKYSFLVSEGTYYLKVEASGYSTYQSDSFVVQKDNGIHQNIELKSNNWLFRISFWEAIILIILIVVLLFLAFNFYKDRRLKIEFKKLKSK